MMVFKTLLLFAFLGAVAQAVSQTRLIVDSVASEISFNPALPMNLSAIAWAEESFTALSHPRFPHHAVRIKKSTFCDPTVSIYTGYLDVDDGAKHLFFYFFESRRDPAQDDVMMWINGGPGCTSSLGLLFELGPCRIDITGTSTNGTTWNPYSWNNEANIFFLDQPVGVGYSYADFGETVETTEDAARNVHAFLSIFFETFKQFAGRRFHLSGESYAGRYLPVFASEIYDQNMIAKGEGRPVINLQSVLIGNGITDVSTLYEGLYDIQCGTSALNVPFQTISNCVQIKAALPRCQAAMRKYCIDKFDHVGCESTVEFCDKHIRGPYWDSGGSSPIVSLHQLKICSGRNVYDVSMICESQDLCYPEDGATEEFLNYPGTRALLGAENPGNFTLCSDAVGDNFVSHLDKWSHHTQDYVAALLERGIRVLIYAGTYDWQCNWRGKTRWVNIYLVDYSLKLWEFPEMHISLIIIFLWALNAVFAYPLRRNAVADIQVLAFANVLEQLESAFYTEALEKFNASSFGAAGFVSPQVPIQQIQTIASDENTHALTLQSAIHALGGQVVSNCTFNFSSALTNVNAMIATARVVENVGVGAYLGSILTVEARHQSILNLLSNATSIPQPFDVALTPADVLAIAGAFISGCKLGFSANPPLTVTNSGPLRAGTKLDFSSPALNGTTSTNVRLSCKIVTGESNASLCQPMNSCMVPANVIGPMYVFITNDHMAMESPSNMNGTMNSSTVIAGPRATFCQPARLHWRLNPPWSQCY
ncbi:Alpha/Beta hydrolase protein [Lanmaoa asiatica]|nr:Alpha/Beta hydrolase protein [Lanmaoa asiatica]